MVGIVIAVTVGAVALQLAVMVQGTVTVLCMTVADLWESRRGVQR